MTAPTENITLLQMDDFAMNKNVTAISDRDEKFIGLVSPDLVLATVSAILVVIMMLANLANVPFFVRGDGTCHKPATLYIIGLMIADLGIALVCQTMMTVILYLGRWPFGYIGCRIYDYFRLALENTGVWIMVVISLDKLQLLCYDYPQYVRKKRKYRIIIEIAMTFLAPMLFHLGGNLVWISATTSEERIDDHSPDCQDIPAEIDTPFVVIGSTLNIFIPGLAIMVINTAVFYKITQRLKKRSKVGQGLVNIREPTDPDNKMNPSLPDTSQPSSSVKTPHRHTNAAQTGNRLLPGMIEDVSGSGLTDNVTELTARNSVRGNSDILARKNYLDTEYRRYIRPAVTLAGLVAIFSICWFPLAIYYIYVHVFCPSCFDITTQLWLRCLMYANSALNPFIFVATNRKIRKFHARMFRKLMPCRTFCRY